MKEREKEKWGEREESEREESERNEKDKRDRKRQEREGTRRIPSNSIQCFCSSLSLIPRTSTLRQYRNLRQLISAVLLCKEKQHE